MNRIFSLAIFNHTWNFFPGPRRPFPSLSFGFTKNLGRARTYQKTKAPEKQSQKITSFHNFSFLLTPLLMKHSMQHSNGLKVLKIIEMITIKRQDKFQ